MKILIAVTHLLGIGHFARMRLLAHGLAQAGHQVTLVSGGRPVPHAVIDGFDLVQLPPVFCKGSDFSTLYQGDGHILSHQTRDERIQLLMATLERVRPEIIITETFPFGRRALKAEFIALCEAADAMRPRPAIVSSIRDVLNPPSSQDKADQAEALIGRFYDAVLVHGDADWVAPAIGWPFGAHSQRALHLTGYIDEAAEAERTIIPHGGILVSGGGSAASLPLYRATIEAATILPHMQWHMLIGHGVSEDDFAALQSAAPPNMKIERARQDFRALLRGASLSVSQAGYNTIVDNFDAGIPMVLVPFAAGQEQEQTLRAKALAARGMAHLVTEADLSGAALADAVRAALAAERMKKPSINRDGVAGSIAALAAVAQNRAAIEHEWSVLDAVLSTIAQSGDRLEVWWRDDDAIAPTPALTRLLSLSQAMQAPVALAVIPASAQPELNACLPLGCDVLVHGWAHTNHAPADAKKQELGHRPMDVIASELRDARARLAALFGTKALPVLVPPWNRIAPALLPLLPDAGFIGVSTFKLRTTAEPAHGLRQVNTHCDPIAWHQGGGLAPEADLVRAVTETFQALARQTVEQREAFGLLTHHLVHDEAIWAFVSRLLATLAGSDAVQFVSARSLFDSHQMVPRRSVLE